MDKEDKPVLALLIIPLPSVVPTAAVVESPFVCTTVVSKVAPAGSPYKYVPFPAVPDAVIKTSSENSMFEPFRRYLKRFVVFVPITGTPVTVLELNVIVASPVPETFVKVPDADGEPVPLQVSVVPAEMVVVTVNVWLLFE